MTGTTKQIKKPPLSIDPPCNEETNPEPATTHSSFTKEELKSERAHLPPPALKEESKPVPALVSQPEKRRSTCKSDYDAKTLKMESDERTFRTNCAGNTKCLKKVDDRVSKRTKLVNTKLKTCRAGDEAECKSLLLPEQKQTISTILTSCGKLKETKDPNSIKTLASEILGNCKTPKDCKKSFRNVSKIYHSDKNNNICGELFKRILICIGDANNVWNPTSNPLTP